MSAVAIQFDPTFSMGPRSAYAWTETMETSSSHNFGQDFSSMLPAVSESGIASPTSSRSMTGSPPRTILTPEQRELKRQRDRARRDSRVSARMHRTNSNSYISSPTLSMTDVTSAMSLPVYTTAPASVSLLGGPSMAGQSYLPPYSPPLHDHSHAFTSHYQQPLQQGYSLPMEYTTSYAPHSDYSIRPTSLPTMGQDGGIMYPVPSGMTQNNPASSSPSASASPSASGPEGSHVRVVQSRPKPRCWEHGCNGRQFSTFSNLLRHQREKSGQAAKATCPNCGAEFTRTTARNGHLLHDKCKQRQNV